MLQRRVNLMDIRDLVLRIRAGVSDRQLQQDTGYNRRTLKRYREWAAQQGLLLGPLAPLEEMQPLFVRSFPEKVPPQNQSSVAPFREVVLKLIQENVEIAAIYARLQERGFTGSYMAVNRFVHAHHPAMPKVTVRVERSPGEESQVDFGYAGLMMDPQSGQLRKTWVFVMTLAWSRHQYAEFVFDQKVENWLRLHRNAFEFFGGVPQRVVPDNLKAAVIRACWDDPQIQHSYRECAQHYGFLIAPCRPRTPEHKGKVEQGGVHYLKRNFLGGREPTLLTAANLDVVVWCRETAGLRLHGTTKEQPLVRFEQTEQAALQPLPHTPYDLTLWKRVKLARDGYVTFEGSFYSAPFRLVSQQLWLCAGTAQVRIFNDHYELVTTHERATRPGERHTHLEHLPPQKVPGLLQTRETCLAEAQSVGPATLQIVQSLLADPVVERLPTAGRLVRLRQRYSDQQLEAACVRALSCSDPSYVTVKGILSKGLLEQPLPPIVLPPPASTFVRTNEELMGDWLEVESWN